MIIIKQPTFNICTCEKCGTVFQPEASDYLYYHFGSSDFEPKEVYIRCPTCDSSCEVTTKEEDGVTDTNVGGKKKYFSPEEVRRMTQSEVKENYYAIMKSMKKWERSEK